jgi:hypothetical protein
LPISRSFLLRKIIHLGSGLVIIYFAEPTGRCYLLFTIFILFALILDSGRNFILPWNKIFLRLVGRLLKNSERKGKLTGATSLWLGMYLSFLLFPLNIFKIAASVVLIADPVAAIGGKIVSADSKGNTKTFTGFALFMGTAILLFWQYWNIPLLPASIISIILGVIELYSPEHIENFLLNVGNGILVFIYFLLR